jgi:tape measure domain-containing protein
MARLVVGEIYLNVKPQDGGVSQGVQRIIDQASDQAAAVPVRAQTGEAEEAVARLGAQIEDDVGGAWIVAAAQAATFTAGVIGARRAIEGAANQLAGIFDQLAQAQAGFTAILGSEAGGSQLLDEIREFARESPFVTQELVNYSQQLLGVGQAAESIVPLLRNTGDLIASVGGDTQNISRVLFTLTQIRSIGRLVGQDAIQLQSALSPITKLLADFLGVTTTEVKKLQEQGAISADTVFAAINNAGSKVEGAMATATRNIGGARAVLSDTFEILLQDSEVLRRVFDDIVQGILGFSEALGDPEIQNDIQSIFEGLDSLYTSLQPLLEGLGGAAATGAISSLQILASTLELLGGALEAIPAPVLDLIGKSLAVLFALKAPLALINYVTSIQRLASVITPSTLASGFQRVTREITTQGAAAETTAASVNRLSAAQSRILTGASAAALGVGLFTSALSESNDELRTFGQTLSGAGIGATLGAQFGGIAGIGAGAGAGAAFGFVQSLITNAREEEERRSEELVDLGTKAAESFYEGFALVNPVGFTTTKVFEDFFAEIEGREDEISAIEGGVAQLESAAGAFDLALSRVLGGITTSGEQQDQAQAFENLLKRINESIDTTTDNLEVQKAELDALFEGEGGEALEEVRSRLAALAKESPQYKEEINAAIRDLIPGDDLVTSAERTRLALLLTGQAAVSSSDDFFLFNDGLVAVDTSITAILGETLDNLILGFSTEVPDAIKETRGELATLKTAFDEAKKAADEFYGSFSINVEAIKSANEQSQRLADGFDRLTGTQGREGGIAFAEALLQNIEAIDAANRTVFNDPVQAVAASMSFANAQFDDLQDSLRLTDIEFQNLLESIGLLDLYTASAGSEGGFVGSIVRLSNETGVAEDRIRELLNLADDLDRTAQISVSADVVDALFQITTLKNQVGSIPGGVTAAVSTVVAQIQRIIALGGGVRTGSSRLTPPGVDINGFDEFAPPDPRGIEVARRIGVENTRRRREEAEKLAEQARKEAERLAEQQRREAERLAEEAARLREQQLREAEAERKRLEAAIESAGETMSSAIDSAAKAIANASDSWVASIRERTQFERGLSADTLIRNTQRQVSDLSELNSGIAALSARGLSSDAQGAIGIDNVADLRQVRRLLQADPATLQRLSGLVAQRDSTAELLARRAQQQETKAVIVASIVEAATILGFDITREQALAISAQIEVTGATDGSLVGQDILETLLNAGRISRT